MPSFGNFLDSFDFRIWIFLPYLELWYNTTLSDTIFPIMSSENIYVNWV